MASRLKIAIFITFLCITGAGCLEFEGCHLHYDIHKDLTGTVTLSYREIHSSAETPEGQKEEMRDFYNKGYREEAAKCARDYGMKKEKVTLYNKTDTKCDAKLVGDFDSIVSSLAPLTVGSDFEIKKKGDRLSVNILSKEINIEEKRITLSITYAGKIVEHNAPTYDQNARVMEWDLGKLDKSGIRFVLEVAE